MQMAVTNASSPIKVKHANASAASISVLPRFSAQNFPRRRPEMSRATASTNSSGTLMYRVRCGSADTNASQNKMHRARPSAPMTKTGPARRSQSVPLTVLHHLAGHFSHPPQMKLVPPGDCTSEPTSRPGRPQYEQQTSAASMQDEAGAAYGFCESLGRDNLELHDVPLHRHRVAAAAGAPFDPA